ncbi:transmembrane protein [Caballeronia calidae]|uniref:Transmembrane protein n=1 Tax=Caballeronia calidae TaxID=1777139 RepID=A0A158E537_9BURK|nr:FimV/HubP family polar landmark protein [Caballeronia calidae]SAL01985.1 transmembrane protein [Caballeronia calidae]
MIQRPRRSFLSSSRAALAAASLAVCAIFWANPGDALAQPSNTPTGQTYAVKPGQSLSDIAGELTGSKDRDVRARAARALFDANPNAFGSHDINKLKLGAVLNVPADLSGAAPGAASAPAAQESAPAATAEAASGGAPAPLAPASESEAAVAAAGAPASAVESQASAPEPQPEAAASAQAPSSAASAPAPATASGTGMAPAVIGLTPFIVGAVIVVIGALLFGMRRGKRRAATGTHDDADRAPRTFSSLEEAQADADRRNEALRTARAAAATRTAGAAANPEGASIARDQSGLGAAAASIENADAPRALASSSGNELPPTIETKPAEPAAQADPARDEPFAPVAPAARHADFVPPPPVAPAGEAEAHEQHDQHAREIAAREAARREAEKWEIEEREAAARQAAAREAEEREIRARETAAREALTRDMAEREAEMRQVTEREALAREAAAREIIAREAELRELQARAAEEQAAEQRAAEQRDVEEEAAREAERSGIAPDEEPVVAHRFPMPKFPQDAIQALGSLEMELPPRMELSIKPPATTEPATPPGGAPSGAFEPPPAGAQPIEQAPFVPQPVSRPASAQQAQSQLQSVASQIEAGTAGAASVAGLGATKFGPLSLDFDLGPASTSTESMPALTPAQLATIARNKLELAAEYIELGDLSGARTLLQEVIESNDPATRPQAATLLSTLAPHS